MFESSIRVPSSVSELNSKTVKIDCHFSGEVKTSEKSERKKYKVLWIVVNMGAIESSSVCVCLDFGLAFSNL